MNVKLYGILLSVIAVIGAVSYILVLRAENKSLAEGKARLELDIADLQKAANDCISDKTISEKASHDFQVSNRSLRRELNSLRNDPHCVSVQPSGAPNGYNGAAAGTELSGRNEVRAGYLYDYAGRSEETRLKLLGCQNFVNELYRTR